MSAKPKRLKEPGERYAKISRRLWADKRFRGLSKPQPNAQSLFVYLLSGPEGTNVPGLIPVGEAALAEAIGWPVPGLRKAFNELEAAGMAMADWGERLVWVPKAVRHNPPANRDVVLGWRGSIALLPECDLKERALDGVSNIVSELGASFADAFAKARGHSGVHGGVHHVADRDDHDDVDAGIDTAPHSGGHQKQEQKQNQKQSQEQEREPSPAGHSVRGLLVKSFQKRWEEATRSAWPGTKQDPDWDRIPTWLERTAPIRDVSVESLIEQVVGHWFADPWVQGQSYPDRHFAKNFERYVDAPKAAAQRGQAKPTTHEDFARIVEQGGSHGEL